ncbi:hypothetical protein L6452_35330 [Arctium lappa]|uniref:Uncharacterized protein n=1 Tax=Arctium lappa TaxID=4217 RepID=A0ACB8Y7L9_ARCLA|nr:hypothetical protein L6452_35330 [Arctium lappa]
MWVLTTEEGGGWEENRRPAAAEKSMGEGTKYKFHTFKDVPIHPSFLCNSNFPSQNRFLPLLHTRCFKP